MTNEVAKRPFGNPSNLPAVRPDPAAEPRTTRALASALSSLLDPHPDIGRRTDSLPLHVLSEAKLTLLRYEALCLPAGPDVVLRWLKPIAAGVRNPPSREQFTERASAIAAVVGDLPAMVFQPRTQRMALASFQFWPAAADVYALLRPEAVPMLAKRDALRRLAAGKAADEPPRPGQAERDAILAKFRADMTAAQAQAAHPGPAHATRPKAAPVTPEQLAAIRAKTGIGR